MSKRKHTKDEKLFSENCPEETTILKKKSKKNQKERVGLISSIVEEIGKMYAYALYRSSLITFHDDSGCYYDTLQSHTIKDGDWLKIYQPSKEMKKYDSGTYHYIFKYKEPITKKQFKDFLPLKANIDKLYLESYNDVLKITNNKWLRKVNGTIEEVAQIVKPFRLDNGELKIAFDVRGFEEFECTQRWLPIKLIAWMECVPEDSITLDSDIREKYMNYTGEATPANII